METNKTIVADVEQVNEMIKQGKVLVIAADYRILRRLTAGNWIGGSIPYFMTSAGGIFSRDKAVVIDLSPYIEEFKIVEYSEDRIGDIPKNYYEHGFNYILIPGFSGALRNFAFQTERIFEFFYSPLVGWVTGVALEELNEMFPIVFNGKSMNESDDSALVLHARLKDNLVAKVDIINIFEPDPESDIFIFENDGFEIFECFINGERRVLAEYLKERNIDKSHPFVADYNGYSINISIKDITDIFVETFAPVRMGVKYRLAKRLSSYEKEFSLRIPQYQPEVVSSFNCIYNYVFGKLESKKLPYTGPFTFGEIAYILLNQTMVNLKIVPKE